MIPELGHFALILALGIAFLQTVAPLLGYQRRDAKLLAFAGSAAQAQFFCIAFAYACLTIAFINTDFSVAYVAQNAHTDLPMIYRVSAVWGAHEGSLLLWMLMLSGWTFAVSVFNRRIPAELSALVIAVLGVISTGLLLFMLLTSNPFERLFPVPLQGRDLNPLLQDFGLAIHPPTLYMGYVGFSVAFAFAVAALITGKLDAAWARWTRPWTTTAWMFLTLGITLGSWWAYNELGWGGWWFWDPVENASFMPWLAGTALIHSLAVTEKRGLLKSWTVLLAILTFSLSLLGTFLVRSGVLVSVHAFASDPARGLFILIFMALVTGSALTLYAWRAPKLATVGELHLFSREGLLLLNNVFLVVACAAILVGTLYPLVIDALKLGKISVGPPYFNAVFLPLMVPLFVLVGFGAVVPWKKGRAGETWQRLKLPALFAVAFAIVVPLALHGRAALLAVTGGLLGAWTIVAASQDVWRRIRAKPSFAAGLASVPRATWGMTLAHAGLGVWALGVAFVISYGYEKDVRLAPNARTEIGDFSFGFVGATEAKGPNFIAQQGEVTIERGDHSVTTLYPQKRFYPSQRNVMTESAVDATLLRDLYVSLGEGFEDGSWSLRIYVKPMIRLIWLGGVLMFLGGCLAASDRRYRLAKAADRRLAVDGGTQAA
ncbi:MAG: heme lyase CcmF/NrfE family subunit [Nevskia sp.]|uniref:heme lyase CcmF/NrfE family subunit n=1 Tax=Nevskia sp. TaxID=1929292 RepID=UPI0040364A9B